ncbi:DUF2314 domain-containing protein, partial [Pyxidicoccus fallax]
PPPLEARLRERFPALRLASGESDPGPLPTVAVTEVALKDYPLPEQGMLEVAARNLAPEEQARLAAAERVTVLHFATEPPAVEAVRQAQALTLELAKERDALLWDEQMVELFSVKDWYERRLEDWDGGEPLLPRHFNTQVYSDWDGTVRLITAGLTTFGLPELGVQQVPAPLADSLGSFLNLVAQLMLEGTAVREDGAFPVAIDALKLAEWREALKLQVRPDARQKTLIALLPVDPKDVGGLPLVEVVFQARPGDTPSERPYAAVAEVFGARSEIVSANEEDAELQAASKAARETLLTRIKPRFQEGLEAESRLLVKAPFDTSDGGIEWMWVHVTAWEGTSLHGTLDSQPGDVPGLKAGAQVTVREDSLFDYLLRRGDGSVEGNTTERIILERAGGAP